jgi:ABC-type multidrug transport system permease subunit
MLRIIFNLTIVQLKKFFRKPAILFWAIGFPIAMSWILGVAFDHLGKTDIVLGIVGSVPHTGPLSTLKNIKWVPTPSDGVYSALREGYFTVYLTPSGNSFVYHFDPKNSAAQATYLAIEKQLFDRQGGSGIQTEFINRKGARYIDFLLPGIAAMSIMNSCLWGIGWGTIEMRMKKMLRRIMATPIPKAAFPMSMFLSRFLVSLVELLILYGFARFYFGTAIQGSWLAILGIITAGNLAFGGIALIVGSQTQTTSIGNGLINAVTLPMMILSGIFFSYRNFPDWAVHVIKYLPLTLVSDSLRLIFNEPVTIGAVMIPILVLSGIGVVATAIGLRIFKWH